MMSKLLRGVPPILGILGSIFLTFIIIYSHISRSIHKLESEILKNERFIIAKQVD
jgi:hypothetical protein